MKLHFLLLSSGILGLLACGPTMKVNSDYDKNANFQQYKTFTLYHDTNKISPISGLNKDRITNAIIAEMTKKGFSQTNSNPDLLVHTVTILKDRVSVTANTNYYGYGGAYRPYGWGTGGANSNTTYDVQNYKDGSLIIDVVDASTQKLLWEGVGSGEIDKPLKNPDAQIPSAIERIMATFPPTPGKKG
jgi:Domain of unknown function (DUF4136)